MSWLVEFARSAEKTDRFRGNPDHRALLAAGLIGEAGSVLAELKKQHRELDAYPEYQRRMLEEIGDFLWYLVRLVTLIDHELLAQFDLPSGLERPHKEVEPLPHFLDFGAAVGLVLHAIASSKSKDELRPLLHSVWSTLVDVANQAKVGLRHAADHNVQKIESRWPPPEPIYHELFDERFSEDEQLPRAIDIEFRESSRGNHKAVTLRCNGLNFGDRLTDNIEDPDGYRYHDVFHFAYAAHLGWSPVLRALFRCKRKSSSIHDEAQDGARAIILDEAVSLMVFSRAKQLRFFEGLDKVDFDLLKTIKEFVRGYEVERAPLWQWEAAIIDGYRIFRELRTRGGGYVTLDLKRRKLEYTAPACGRIPGSCQTS